MTIIIQKDFEKDLKKASTKVQEKFFDRLTLFEKDQFNPILNNHALKGEYLGYRSINVTGNLRAIFKITGEEATFVVLDSHSNLYN